MFRRIAAVVAGIFAGMLFITFAGMIPMKMAPPPEDFSWDDPVKVCAFIQSVPTNAMIAVLCAHVFGAFVAGIVAALISRMNSVYPPLIIGIIFTASGVANLFMIKCHPTWFAIADTALYLPLAFFGYWLAIGWVKPKAE